MADYQNPKARRDATLCVDLVQCLGMEHIQPWEDGQVSAQLQGVHYLFAWDDQHCEVVLVEAYDPMVPWQIVEDVRC